MDVCMKMEESERISQIRAILEGHDELREVLDVGGDSRREMWS